MFSKAVKEKLRHYVYALVDPRDNEIFYIGKASGNDRAFHHLKAKSGETAKARRIASIRKTHPDGPRVEVLRYNLPSAKMAFEVEAALIDAFGLNKLTNIVRGHGVNSGRFSQHELERIYGAKPALVESIADSHMLFFINKSYTSSLSEQELYDNVRQFWYKVGRRTRIPTQTGELRYRTALALFDSVVVAAFKIETWYPAGTTFSSRPYLGSEKEERWEFVGQRIDHKLVGRRLEKDGKPLVALQRGYGYVN